MGVRGYGVWLVLRYFCLGLGLGLGGSRGWAFFGGGGLLLWLSKWSLVGLYLGGVGFSAKITSFSEPKLAISGQSPILVKNICS